MYDDAGDSLLHVLPGRWPVVHELPAERAAPSRASAAFDFELERQPPQLRHRRPRTL
jgi:hypothetical protein